MARPSSRAASSAPPRTVRLSLTDRCDLACVYCRPHRNDGYFERKLDLPAWKTLTEGLVHAGIRRVRITGGEPLLHADVVAFVSHLATLGLDDLALTTNATRLEALAVPLRAAGLRRLNISIDTLDPARFFRLTRGGDLDGVLRGIDAAVAARFDEIKLNTVVVRGENDRELEPLVRFAWERRMTPRFLEIMAIGEGAKMQASVVPHEEMRAQLAHLLVDGEPAREPNRGPAKYVAARHDPALRVGFITGTTDTYCKGCDRLRVTATGMLRPCLATSDGVPGTAATPADVAAQVEQAWAMKPDGETFKGCTEDSAKGVSIRQIGG